MIKAVTLDLWNTLLEDHRLPERKVLRTARLRELLRAAGVEAGDEQIDDAMQASWDNFDRIWVREHRTPTTTESASVVLASLKAPADPELYQKTVTLLEEIILEAPPRPVAGVVKTLPLLAKRYALAVVCDSGLTPGRVLRQVLDSYGLTSHFGSLFFSDEHGFCKPDPRAFHTALDAIGVPPGKAVHVGDIQRTDVAGAHHAGLLAVHFMGVNASDASLSTGEVQLYDFAKLPAALERLG
jgi:FMN phosphatase YigB (HAD superfamily)